MKNYGRTVVISIRGEKRKKSKKKTAARVGPSEARTSRCPRVYDTSDVVRLKNDTFVCFLVDLRDKQSR